ncbi:hypothetical protein B0H14DRAFT_1131539 [Mycena olivaceomarginata]|nr:hypothetical protein B0H14DRAFT_1131539 [Mycena olivaceomarginata]
MFFPGSAIGMVYDTTPRSCTPRWGGGPGDARARCQPRRAHAPPADAARICEGVGRRAGSAGCVGKGRGGVWAEQDQCYDSRLTLSQSRRNSICARCFASTRGVDWRQRTPTQWKAELRSWRAVILDLMHDCFAVLDFPLPSATAALQNFAAVRPSTRRAQTSS